MGALTISIQREICLLSNRVLFTWEAFINNNFFFFRSNGKIMKRYIWHNWKSVKLKLGFVIFVLHEQQNYWYSTIEIKVFKNMNRQVNRILKGEVVV